MRSSAKLCLALVCLGMVACGGSSSSKEARPALDLEFSDPPIDLEGTAAKFVADLRYGEGERNFLDIYLPECSEPTALVIYVHGGGFTGGNKSAGHRNPGNVREFLDNCVAFATINYFLLDVPSRAEGTDSIAAQGGVLSSLRDAAQSLQFLRYNFAILNLDPTRVAMYGASAGAGASLWMATRDDMADADSANPVARESTRILAAGALATQSTYDVMKWDTILMPITEQFAEALGGTDIPTVAAAVGATNYMLTFLGVPEVADIYTPENAEYRASIDMLGMMDAEDAPLFVRNYATGFEDLLNVFLHTGLHALAVMDRADAVGLENVTYVEGTFAREDPSGLELVPFLLGHLE